MLRRFSFAALLLVALSHNGGCAPIGGGKSNVLPPGPDKGGDGSVSSEAAAAIRVYREGMAAAADDIARRADANEFSEYATPFEIWSKANKAARETGFVKYEAAMERVIPAESAFDGKKLAAAARDAAKGFRAGQ